MSILPNTHEPKPDGVDPRPTPIEACIDMIKVGHWLHDNPGLLSHFNRSPYAEKFRPAFKSIQDAIERYEHENSDVVEDQTPLFFIRPDIENEAMRIFENAHGKETADALRRVIADPEPEAEDHPFGSPVKATKKVRPHQTEITQEELQTAAKLILETAGRATGGGMVNQMITVPNYRRDIYAAAMRKAELKELAGDCETKCHVVAAFYLLGRFDAEQVKP